MTADVIHVNRPVPTTPHPRAEIYKNLRQCAAMASGLEAMAVRALEVGDATEQNLESIADLSTMLYQELILATIAINELSGS